MKTMTAREVRAAFWKAHPECRRKRIRDHAGTGLMYPADTRCAFVDFVDHLARAGEISESVAARVTLDPPRDPLIKEPVGMFLWGPE